MADVGSLLGGLGIGGNIGKAIVQLELDTKKYQSEMTAAESKTRSFGSFANTAFLAVGTAAVVGLGMSVKAALDAQEAQAQLHNTIANAPQLAKNSEQAFLDLAESIRSTTGADDEAILSGIALQGNMGLTQDQIEQLTPLVVDLASKYDIDLQSAFKAVGKAATGSTGALSRYVGAIDKGATPADTFANVLEKLGGAAGFAADKADRQPWLLIQSDFEEISEDIGTALLPAIESLADALHGLVPILGDIARGIQFLPLIQMSEDVGTTDSAVVKLTKAIVDSIPVLGSYVDDIAQSGHVFGGLTDAVVATTQEIPGFVDGLNSVAEAGKGVSHSGADARRAIVSFAHKTGAELEKWASDTEQAFGDFVLSLDESADHTKITRKEFRDAVNAMLKNSRDLSQAMRTLSKEKWVNDDFIAFLSEQGPEWLIGFANLNKEQQRKFQDDWERSNGKLKDANSRFETMIGLLDDLDSGTSKHTVQIKYEYVGFDPSKPGMKP